ncbi:MAG: hypothetical protein OHK0029_25830 [Armatimonadaceae bacterium]
MKNLLTQSFLPVVAVGLLAMPVSAQVTVYTDVASFQSALQAGSTVFTEDFSDSSLNTGLSFSSNSGESVISSGRFNDRLTPGETTTFSFAPPVYAFGGNFDLNPGGAGLGLRLSLDTLGGPVTITQQVPNSYTGQFFGIISTVSFTSVNLSSGDQGGIAETYNLDNLLYARVSTVQPVPEPGEVTVALFLVSAIAIGLIQGRRRNAAVLQP